MTADEFEPVNGDFQSQMIYVMDSMNDGGDDAPHANKSLSMQGAESRKCRLIVPLFTMMRTALADDTDRRDAWYAWLLTHGASTRGGTIVRAHNANEHGNTLCMSTAAFTLIVTAVCCVLGSLIGVGVLLVCQRRKRGDKTAASTTHYGNRLFAPPPAMVSWVDSAHNDGLMK
jgi:hypothetical protein